MTSSRFLVAKGGLFVSTDARSFLPVLVECCRLREVLTQEVVVIVRCPPGRNHAERFVGLFLPWGVGRIPSRYQHGVGVGEHSIFYIAQGGARSFDDYCLRVKKGGHCSTTEVGAVQQREFIVRRQATRRELSPTHPCRRGSTSVVSQAHLHALAHARTRTHTLSAHLFCRDSPCFFCVYTRFDLILRFLLDHD